MGGGGGREGAGKQLCYDHLMSGGGKGGGVSVPSDSFTLYLG